MVNSVALFIFAKDEISFSLDCQIGISDQIHLTCRINLMLKSEVNPLIFLC